MKKLSLLLLLVVISMTANAAFISGKYIGNGQSTKAITGLCFRPEVVFISGSSSQHAWVATSTMPAGKAKDLTLPDPLKTGYISSLDADGFTVGNSTHSNAPGVTYYYMAWDDADGSISVGSFTPNSCGSDWTINTWYGQGTLVKYGSVNYKAKNGVWSTTSPDNDPGNWENAGACGAFNTNITTGSRPKMLWLFGEGSNWDNLASAQLVFDNSNSANPAGFTNGGYLSGEEKIINGLHTTGFSVTPVVQAGTHNGTANGTKYNYVAFNPSTTTVAGTYTGTAVDNKLVSTISSKFVMTKPITNAAGNPWFKTCNMGTDTSYSFAGVNSVMNIKNFTSSGFTVGYSGEVNDNGGSYEYFAMSGGACALSSCGSSCTLTMSNDTTTCIGANTTISVTPSGSSNYTYSWTPSAGLSSATIANPVANPSVTTTYKVTVTGDGGCSKTDSVKITVSQLEWAELNGVSFNCETLTKTAVDGYYNGSAFSKNHLNANQDGWVEFTVMNNNHEHYGLALKNYSDYNLDIRYGFLVANGTIYLIQKGANISSESAVLGDKLKVERAGSLIKYYKNGNLLASLEANALSEKLFIDVALYYSGHTVKVATSFTTAFDVYAAINDNNPAAASRDGSISLEPLNESGTVTYSWNSGATTANLTGLSSGTYTVTIMDAGGHSSTQSYTILNKAVWTKLVNMSDIGNSRLTKTTPENQLEGNGMSKVFLPAGQDGYVEYFTTDKGNASIYFGLSSLPTNFNIQYYAEQDINYSYLWYGSATYIREGGSSKLNAGAASTTSTLRIAREGSYIVYYVDGVEAKRTETNSNRDLFLKFEQAGQVDQGIFRTSFGGGIQPYYEITDNNPVSTSDGSISTEAYGGVAPYSYSWSNGATTANVSNLLPGQYTLTITDAANQTNVKIFKVMNKVVWKNLNGMTLQANDRLKKTATADDFTSGWGSSKNYLPAGQDGEITLELTRTSHNAYIGFSAHPILLASDLTKNIINYALYTNSNYFMLAEGGYNVYNHGLAMGGGTELKLARETNSTTNISYIVYYVNGAEVRRVVTQLNQDLFVAFSQSAPNFDLGKVRVSFGHELQASYDPITDNDPLQTPSGAIAAEAIGGTGPYTYSWKKGSDNTVISTNASISNLTPGNYILTINDANSNTTNKTFVVANKAAWTNLNNVHTGVGGFLQKTTNTGITDCWGSSVNFIPSGEEGWMEYTTLSFTFMVMGLAKDPFVYSADQWGDIQYAAYLWQYTRVLYHSYWTGEEFESTSRGGDLYRFERKINATTGKCEMIYSSNGFERARREVDINENLYAKFNFETATALGQFRMSHGHELNASANITHRDINVSSNAAIDVTQFGGNSASYTSEWSSGQTTADISGLKKGTYTLTTTDASNTTKSNPFEVLNVVSWEHASGITMVDNLVKVTSANSLATSKNYLDPNQNGRLVFDAANANLGTFGFTTSDQITSSTNIKYGFFQYASYLYAIYNGNSVALSDIEYFHGGNRLTLERVGTSLIYKLNGVQVYQNTVPADEKLYVGIFSESNGVKIYRVLANFGEGLQPLTVTYTKVDEATTGDGSIDLNIDGGSEPYIVIWGDQAAIDIAELNTELDSICIDSTYLPTIHYDIQCRDTILNNLSSLSSFEDRNNLKAGIYKVLIIDQDFIKVVKEVVITNPVTWGETSGVIATTNGFTKTLFNGWTNAYVTSQNQFDIGVLSYTTSGDEKIALGIINSETTNTTGASALDYGIKMDNGALAIIQQGSEVSLIQTYVAGDVISIEKSEIQIQFKLNDAVIGFGPLPPPAASVVKVQSWVYSFGSTLKTTVMNLVTALPTIELVKVIYPVHCDAGGLGAISIAIANESTPSQYTYSWSGPNGYTSSLKNINGLKPGTYIVTATNTKILFGKKTTSKTVVLNQIPTWTKAQNVTVPSSSKVSKTTTVGVGGINSLNTLKGSTAKGEFSFKHAGFVEKATVLTGSYNKVMGAIGLSKVNLTNTLSDYDHAIVFYNKRAWIGYKYSNISYFTVTSSSGNSINYYGANQNYTSADVFTVKVDKVAKVIKIYVNQVIKAQIVIANPSTQSFDYAVDIMLNQTSQTVTENYISDINVNFGCEGISADNLTIEAAGGYYHPARELDGSFALTKEGVLYLKYDEKYNDGNLKYRVYDSMRKLKSNSVVSKKYGLNLYALNFNSLSLSVGDIYTLEVENDKGQKRFLHFRYYKDTSVANQEDPTW